MPVVVTAVPVVLLLANQLNLLNLSDSTAHTLGVNLTRLRLVINMLVLLLVGACVSVAGPVTRDRLLAFLDQEMSDSLSYHFWNSGVGIRPNEEDEKIEGCDDGVIMHLKSGKKLKADCLLYANGRTGNTDSLALQNMENASSQWFRSPPSRAGISTNHALISISIRC